MPGGTRQRLDRVLVDRGLSRSRAAALDAIRRGHVLVDGTAARKPGQLIAENAEIAVHDPAAGYVSRAALKLIAGLDRFGFMVEGRTALDLGASTGGFTQVLLERGARHVVAVDVGHGQMAPQLARDERVSRIEGLNCRTLSASHLGGRHVDALVCDVSFISVRLALPPALDLVEPGSWAIILFKPQFELGADALGKGGIVRDPAAAEAAAGEATAWLSDAFGWEIAGIAPSPITGGTGNTEYLIGARKPAIAGKASGPGGLK